MTQYGKKIKKKLIDIERSQKWLIGEVKKETGLFFDSSYLAKIINGTKNTPKIVNAINRILEVK